MESYQSHKRKQEIEGLPDGRPPRPSRFRIVKLEERIAPKKGGGKKTWDCGGGTEACLTGDTGNCVW